jgi:hypothetical protein
MILTTEQKSNVSVLVDNETMYLETYRELYDHMISSMEARDSLPDLQKAYRDILEDDFGGPFGLRQLERDHQATLKGAMEQLKDEYFYTFFKWPGIIVPIAIAVACGYGIYISKFVIVWLYLGTLLALIFPFIFIGIGNMIIYFKRGDVKRSVKNNSLKAMAVLFFWYYVGSCILGNLFRIIFRLFKATVGTMRVIDGMVILVVFMFTFLYAIAAYKAYVSEFKMRTQS